MSNDANRTIDVLGTGGTIAGTASVEAGDANYNAAQLSVAALLSGVSGMTLALGGHLLRPVQVAQIDSKDMSVGVWCDLAGAVCSSLQDDTVQGVVITHGTDTLEETATWLQGVVPQALLARKPVVLTCAMRPATSVDADGPANLRDAVEVAVRGSGLGLTGVLVVCAAKVHHGLAVRKVHSHRLDAFDSGDSPLVGRFTGEGAQRALQVDSDAILMNNQSLVSGFIGFDAPESGVADWLDVVRINGLPRVEIVHSHAGADGGVVRDLLSLGEKAPKGFVVAATGNGTVHHALEAELRVAKQLGVWVWRSTRCILGAVTPRDDDMLALTPLTPAKARVAMQVSLSKSLAS